MLRTEPLLEVFALISQPILQRNLGPLQAAEVTAVEPKLQVRSQGGRGNQCLLYDAAEKGFEYGGPGRPAQNVTFIVVTRRVCVLYRAPTAKRKFIELACVPMCPLKQVY